MVILGAWAPPDAPAKNVGSSCEQAVGSRSHCTQLSRLPLGDTAPENSDRCSRLEAKPATGLINSIPIRLVFLLIITLHDNVAESA